MQSELMVLLAVQDDDVAIRALEGERASLEPRVAALDKARDRAHSEAERAQTAIDRETDKYRTLEARIADHRIRHEKNVATLDQARRLREATAAMQQLEMARRVLAEEESELAALARRLGELASALEANRAAVASLEQEQVGARAELAAEAERLDAALKAARSERDAKAAGVNASLLARYDRIAGRRRTRALFPLRGLSCSACDTAIPLQRRNALLVGGVIDLCEACGVLLYAEAEPETASADTPPVAPTPKGAAPADAVDAPVDLTADVGQAAD